MSFDWLCCLLMCWFLVLVGIAAICKYLYYYIYIYIYNFLIQ